MMFPRLCLRAKWLFVLVVCMANCGFATAQNGDAELAELRTQADNLSAQQNWQNALDIYAQLLVDKRSTGGDAARDLTAAYDCMQQLGLVEQLDPLLGKGLGLWSEDWRFLAEAARLLQGATHHGQMDGDVFVRSPRQRRQGRWLQSSLEQDRLQALKWLEKALKLCGQIDGPAADGHQASAAEIGQLWSDMLSLLLQHRAAKLSWQLQTKTDLQAKIEFNDDQDQVGRAQRNAPVDGQGEPIFYDVPASWAAADSDGQRCRWSLKQAQAADDPEIAAEATYNWAMFLYYQFDVQTLQEQIWLWGMQSGRSRQSAAQSETADQTDEDSKIEDQMSALLQLHTLTDDETIAMLASGMKRFKYPEDQNPIAMLKALAAGKLQHSTSARDLLVTAYLNRRQHAKAAQILKDALSTEEARNLSDELRAGLQNRLDDIVKARGSFESVPAQTAGTPVKLSLKYRNAKTVKLTARKLDLEKLLASLKKGRALEHPLLQTLQYPGSMPENFIGEYLSAPVASWSVDLQPAENHWDKHIDIIAPLDKGGLYIVDANLDDGQHQARCGMWVNDMSIVYKPIEKDNWFYVVDALSGKPMNDINVEFIGLGTEYANFARKTDSAGQVRYRLPANNDGSGLQSDLWIIVARDGKGRLAICTPQSLFEHAEGAIEPESFPFPLKAYGIVEQPIYRPGNKVRAKLWLGEANYANAHPLKNHTIQVGVVDPRGKRFWTENLTTDNYGGVEMEFDVPASASLGLYAFTVFDRAAQTHFECNMRFRVEEFRKPEFEVTIEAPENAVQLGEKVEAKIRAKYFFGTPVTDATVDLKVTRSTFVDDWYPIRPFDWCYGRGYWWPAYSYQWFPRWHIWHGCFPIVPPGRPWGMEPPEVVIEQQVKLDDQGAATISIDTALAAKFQSKQDHQYDISVQVRDASRRTISADGSVIAAREAFKIYSWLHRGFYRVGETVEANFLAQTLNRKPVSASGKLDLLRITYDEQRRPQETIVESWDARTDEEGGCTHKLVVRRGGQYRLRLKLKDQAGHEVEGAYIFTVRGDNQAADSFRFSELELITAKPEYAPGEEVELQINADRADANVVLFIKPKMYSASSPKFVQLVNKTARLTIKVDASDQPNFFVEAFTVYDGKFYHSLREIFVPPIKKALEVKVTADKKEYLPGDKAKLEIEVKDLYGKPVQGDVLVSVYDRALEQLAGDALPPDIREFFWKWRRVYDPNHNHTLDRPVAPIMLENVPWMAQLGMFDDLLNHNPGGGMMGGVFGYGYGGMGGATEGMAGGMGGGIGGMMGVGGMGRGNMGGMMGGGMGEAMLSAAAPARAASADAGMGMGSSASSGQPSPTKVRQEFADSAFWLTNLKCDREGRAKVEFDMPENLTDWQMRVWSVGSDLNVGSGTTTAVTHKNILVRLAAPRFLTERDQVVLSAIVHNDFDQAHDVQVRLEIDGETQLQVAKGIELSQTVHIEAHGQKRVDWTCDALAEGEVTLRAFAEAAAQSDAMQIKFPIIVNGTLKTESWAGTLRPDQASGRIKVTIPQERRPAQSKLTVRVSPSLASAIVDALPYLASYPHGCTEQTLNRFLPTVLTQRMLIDMRVDLKKVKANRRNLNAQQLGDPAERAAQWQMFANDPVFDNVEVARMVDVGVDRLTKMQNADGGWGWFYDHSSAHTTATVVRGLVIARDAGAAIVPDVIERGLNWLDAHQAASLEKQDPQLHEHHSMVFVFHTLVIAGRPANQAMLQWLIEKGKLNVYDKALLALATHKLGNAELTAKLRKNVEQFLVQDAENETAYVRNESSWWYWYGSQNEATAYYLKLLSAVDPKNPTAARLVKYLLNNRQGGRHWKSTRDTALIVEAFTDYLKGTGENKSQVSGEVLLGGKRLGSFQFTPETLFTANNTIEIAGNAVPTGEHELEIRRQGQGPLYFSAYSTNFTLEEEIAPAGLEVKVERRYYRLDPVKKDLSLPGDRGQVIATQRSTFDRTLIENLQAVPSGTLIEVELKLVSKNDYEYLLVQEPKAAGLEPVDTQSGSVWGPGYYAYRELRDQQVSFYVDWLPQGEHVLSYQLRAEAPGRFTALPAIISGMYAPELVGNSSDKDITVTSP